MLAWSGNKKSVVPIICVYVKCKFDCSACTEVLKTFGVISVVMPSTSKKLTGHIGFELCVRPCVHPSVRSRTLHARVLKFHKWIPHGKIFDSRFFFSCPSYLPFWSYAPLKKIRTKSDACHILWTMNARVLKFHIWIPHGKIADPYIFFCPRYLPFWSYAPLKKSAWNLVSKISQSIWARGLKHGQLIGDDE